MINDLDKPQKNIACGVLAGIILSFAFLAGCGNEDQGGTMVINPVHESSYEEIVKLDGITMSIPNEAHDEEYVRIVTGDGVTDEVSFYYGEEFYNYRAKNTKGFEDISGTYYNWTQTSNIHFTNDDMQEPPKVYENGDGQGLILWYKEGISYSVFMPSEATEDKLINIFKLLMSDS